MLKRQALASAASSDNEQDEIMEDPEQENDDDSDDAGDDDEDADGDGDQDDQVEGDENEAENEDGDGEGDGEGDGFYSPRLTPTSSFTRSYADPAIRFTAAPPLSLYNPASGSPASHLETGSEERNHLRDHTLCRSPSIYEHKCLLRYTLHALGVYRGQ